MISKLLIENKSYVLSSPCSNVKIKFIVLSLFFSYSTLNKNRKTLLSKEEKIKRAETGLKRLEDVRQLYPSLYPSQRGRQRTLRPEFGGEEKKSKGRKRGEEEVKASQEEEDEDLEGEGKPVLQVEKWHRNQPIPDSVDGDYFSFISANRNKLM